MGGQGGFLPCGIGSHLSRLRHFGWRQCGQGLTSRPLDSCLLICIGPLLSLLECASHAVVALVHRNLRLWYCNTPFAKRLFSPWPCSRNMEV